jgi:ketopantoate reductase PanE/ApbA-like protein
VRIAVMGTGGVGGCFGAQLARAGESVAFVARGVHLRAIRSSGLAVRSVDGDVVATAPATDDPARVPELIGPVDLEMDTPKDIGARVWDFDAHKLVDDGLFSDKAFTTAAQAIAETGAIEEAPPLAAWVDKRFLPVQWKR